MMPGRALRTAGWLRTCLAWVTRVDSVLGGVVATSCVPPAAEGGALAVVVTAVPLAEAAAGAMSALAGFKVAVVMMMLSRFCFQACGHHTGMLSMSSYARITLLRICSVVSKASEDFCMLSTTSVRGMLAPRS